MNSLNKQFSELIAKNFPNLDQDMQTQEELNTLPKEKNKKHGQKRNFLHVIVKMSKMQIKETTLKAQEKNYYKSVDAKTSE